MNKIRVVLQVVAVLAAWLIGLHSWAGDQSNWQGYLIDRQCAESVREDSDPLAFVLHHKKDCALMPNCRAKGYSLFADGKWYDLDKRGNDLSVKLLKASKKTRAFFVQIQGTKQGNVLKVQSMKESEAPKAKNGAEKEHHGNN